MFFRRKQIAERKAVDSHICPESQYASGLKVIMAQVHLESSDYAKAAYLDFAIDVIASELEADTTAVFVRTGSGCTVKPFFIPYKSFSETWRDVDLSPYHVVSCPISSVKLRHAAISEWLRGFVKTDNYTSGVLYEDINVVVIENGRHHQAVANTRKEAYANTLDVVRTVDFHNNLSTNGGTWSYNDGENKMQALCPDYRLALLYTLSQERKRFHAAKPKTPEELNRLFLPK